MKFDFDSILAIFCGELLLVVAGFYKGLFEIGFDSLRAFIIAGAGAIGGLFAKFLFNYIKNKYFKK